MSPDTQQMLVQYYLGMLNSIVLCRKSWSRNETHVSHRAQFEVLRDAPADHENGESIHDKQCTVCKFVLYRSTMQSLAVLDALSHRHPVPRVYRCT